MCFPNSSLSHWVISASSSRTPPRNTGQMPVRARTSVVLPPPLGPITPTAWPARISKVTSLSKTRPDPGAATVIPSTFKVATGAGSAIGSSVAASAVTVSFKRPNAVRAATTCFQLPMARSIGASARPDATDAARIAPAESSPIMAR